MKKIIMPLLLIVSFSTFAAENESIDCMFNDKDLTQIKEKCAKYKQQARSDKSLKVDLKTCRKRKKFIKAGLRYCKKINRVVNRFEKALNTKQLKKAKRKCRKLAKLIVKNAKKYNKVASSDTFTDKSERKARRKILNENLREFKATSIQKCKTELSSIDSPL